MKAIGVLIGFMISMPIWFYLLYKILVAVNASDLMWFMYYAYIPATFLAAAIMQLAKSAEAT